MRTAAICTTVAVTQTGTRYSTPVAVFAVALVSNLLESARKMLFVRCRRRCCPGQGSHNYHRATAVIKATGATAAIGATTAIRATAATAATTATGAAAVIRATEATMARP